MRECRDCRRALPDDAFYASNLAACKDCRKERARRHRLENVERVREYDRQRSRDPRRRAAQRRQARLHNERNPSKRSARVAVNNALRGGRLERGPCEVCGSSDTQAHHDDYGRPLEVRWLCQPHHVEHHVGARAQHTANV